MESPLAEKKPFEERLKDDCVGIVISLCYGLVLYTLYVLIY